MLRGCFRSKAYNQYKTVTTATAIVIIKQKRSKQFSDMDPIVKC